jgi:hypothetical protein
MAVVPCLTRGCCCCCRWPSVYPFVEGCTRCQKHHSLYGCTWQSSAASWCCNVHDEGERSDTNIYVCLWVVAVRAVVVLVGGFQSQCCGEQGSSGHVC